MSDRYKPSVNVVFGVIILFVVAVIIGMIFFYLEIRGLSETVQKKFDGMPVTVQKYDSITQAKLDSLDVKKEIDIRNIIQLDGDALQNALDSAFND